MKVTFPLTVLRRALQPGRMIFLVGSTERAHERYADLVVLAKGF